MLDKISCFTVLIISVSMLIYVRNAKKKTAFFFCLAFLHCFTVVFSVFLKKFSLTPGLFGCANSTAIHVGMCCVYE